MSGALAETTLIQHLPNIESMEILAREGLPDFCLPTEELRRVYTWALDQYHRSGQSHAPSVEAIKVEWGDLLSDHEIDIDEEPEDSIEWSIDVLKGQYIYREVVTFNKALAAAMADATTDERIEVIADFSTRLVALSMDMQSKEDQVDLREGIDAVLSDYMARAEDRESIYGMRFGLPQIDDYTRGIHPGELAVLAAGPKVGKSYFLALAALREWEAGRAVTLFTLENSVKMTLDRMACLAVNLDSRAFQQGLCTPEEIARVELWREKVVSASNPLYIVQPEPGKRTVEMLVREAQLKESDSLFIDQLTFLEPEDERAPRHLQIREMTHTLKSMISSGRKKMPCLLAHQINREGVKSADKVGHLEMYHLAEGSEVERTADWVFGLHRTQMERDSLAAKFQTLAARREDTRHFLMTWSIDVGFVNVRSEYDIENDRPMGRTL